MRSRYYNALILTGDMEISKGEIAVENGVITDVSETEIEDCDESTDLHGNLIIPGFCNAHTHSAMTFLRSLADDLPLERWLNEKIFPREAKLGADDIYTLTKLAVMEYLASGITSCFDMYFFPEAFSDAVYDCGFRAVLCGAVNNFSESVPLLEDYYNRFNNNEKYGSLISYKLGFHAEYTTDEAILRDISELAHKYKAPVFCHNSETENEVRQCIERHKTTPTEYLDSLGMFDHGGGGFHCVYMSEKDREIFREKKLYAVTNPCSNAKLASGIAPISEYIENGIDLAIGTDGPASNNALSMFREMYLLSSLQNIKYNSASAVSAKNILRMATVGGNDCMGLSGGYIEKGKTADFAVIDLNKPNMRPFNNIVSNLIYSGSDSNVYMTVVNGRILYKNGEYFIGEEPEKIYAEAQKITDRIASMV